MFRSVRGVIGVLRAMKIAALGLASLVVLSGCASKEIKMYDGAVLPDSETVSIVYTTRAGGAVQTVDGVAAPSGAIQIGRLIMLPGKHTYGVAVSYDYTIEGNSILNKRADGFVEIDGVKGHTYVFTWKRVGSDQVAFGYDDMGANYPKGCFDIRRAWSEPEVFYSQGCR